MKVYPHLEKEAKCLLKPEEREELDLLINW